MKNLYETFGGRKVFSGYVAFVALTIMAFFLDATYQQYATWITISLGITSGFTAWEDIKRNGDKQNPERRVEGR